MQSLLVPFPGEHTRPARRSTANSSRMDRRPTEDVFRILGLGLGFRDLFGLRPYKA